MWHQKGKLSVCLSSANTKLHYRKVQTKYHIHEHTSYLLSQTEALPQSQSANNLGSFYQVSY